MVFMLITSGNWAVYQFTTTTLYTVFLEFPLSISLWVDIWVKTKGLYATFFIHRDRLLNSNNFVLRSTCTPKPKIASKLGL